MPAEPNCCAFGTKAALQCQQSEPLKWVTLSYYYPYPTNALLTFYVHGTPLNLKKNVCVCLCYYTAIF